MSKAAGRTAAIRKATRPRISNSAQNNQHQQQQLTMKEIWACILSLPRAPRFRPGGMQANRGLQKCLAATLTGEVASNNSGQCVRGRRRVAKKVNIYRYVYMCIYVYTYTFVWHIRTGDGSTRSVTRGQGRREDGSGSSAAPRGCRMQLIPDGAAQVRRPRQD